MQAPEWAPQQTIEKALENVLQHHERPHRGGLDMGNGPSPRKVGSIPRVTVQQPREQALWLGQGDQAQGPLESWQGWVVRTWETFERMKGARTWLWGSKETGQVKNKAITNSREEKKTVQKRTTVVYHPTQNDLNRLINILDMDLTKIVSYLGKRAHTRELKSSCTINGRQQITPKIGQ